MPQMPPTIPLPRPAHCLLVSANCMSLPYPVYPIGVAYLMASLRRHGHLADHVDILATGGYQELERRLRQNSYDLVGVSIRNIDTVDSTSPDELLADIAEAVRLIRRHSKAPLVLGGAGFSIMPERLLDHFQADYGIVGEGEEALPELIARLLTGDVPRERLFSRNLAGFPDCPPLYCREIIPYYLSHGGMLNVQTKRGCRHNCAYCSYPAIEGRTMRYREPGAIVSEIVELSASFGARYIFFTDGVFNDPDGHYLEIAEALARAGNRIPWCAFFRPQHLRREGLRLLKRSGLAAMELGTDATTDQTLAALGKGFGFTEVLAVNEAIVAEGIPCAHFVMFGGPGETEETVEEGLANLERLDKAVIFAYLGIRILPNTRLYDRALLEKVVTVDADLIRPIFYYSPQVDREMLDGRLRRAFHGRRDRLFPVSRCEQLIPALHRRGYDGPLWNMLIDFSAR
jgi:radical SAM superfamily enzyme YgiQ (UPF0313 family)